MISRTKFPLNRVSLLAWTFVCLCTLVAAQEAEKEIIPADERDPAHVVLYKSGFYREAIAILEEKVKNRASDDWLGQARYLGYCYVLTDQKRSAIEWFRMVLEADSSFQPDSLDVPPKIVEVFREAKDEWQRFREFSSSPSDSMKLDSGLTPMLSPYYTAIPGNRISPWLCFVPGGYAQFAKGHKKRGVTLLAIETLTLGSSLLFYYKLQDSKHPDFVMWPGNEKDIRLYLDLYRIPFGMFVFSYAYGVIDAFVAGGTKP